MTQQKSGLRNGKLTILPCTKNITSYEDKRISIVSKAQLNFW